tara:strand:- start:394 stop:1146 length:753 start_codon:yes stop_codon:yes gene_type:complete
MKKKPLISIVITYYKKKKYIKKTLNSILNQSYKNYEVIFVYDDEEKEDLKYIKKLIILFKKKKLIINKKNIGVARSRNIAMKFCKGNYISFIDSDDFWIKNKLDSQISFMINKNYKFSFTSFNVVDDNNKIIGVRNVYKDPEYKDLIKTNYIGLSTVIFHKKLLNIMRFPDLNTQEDFALWLNLLKKGYKLSHFKKNLSSWRKTENSLSSNSIQKIKDAFTLYYKFENKNLILSIYSVLVLAYNKLKKLT